MGNLKVKNGTPVGSAHLCKGCVRGQYTTGYRESDVLVICTNSDPARVVPFVVHECTDYWDRRRPDWEQMEKLALNFTEVARRKRTPGFSGSGFARVLVTPAEESEDEAEEPEDKLEEVAEI